VRSNDASNMITCLTGLGVSIVGLERALLQYTKEPTVSPFDIKSVPIDTAPLVPKQSMYILTVVCSECYINWSSYDVSTVVHYSLTMPYV